ncbi:MAG TPA: hypothetical protein PLN33_07160 [Hyphomonadaceae bacterium]|nr:hypothetical protein [Hyphomonadaceae bacterium]HPN04281.1 hypothetical protein [Hyphomonadaceae bacterium]
MTRHAPVLAFLTLSLALAACGPVPTAAETEARVREATVTALPGVSASEVAIDKFERRSAKTTWSAVVGGKVYNCDADESLRLPACQQIS